MDCGPILYLSIYLSILLSQIEMDDVAAKYNDCKLSYPTHTRPEGRRLKWPLCSKRMEVQRVQDNVQACFG